MKFVYVILLAFASNSLFAQVWIAAGPGPKNWSDGFNWSTGAPPGPAESATFDGTSNIACKLTADVSIANIVINGFTGTIAPFGFNLTMQAGNSSFMSGSFIGSGNVIVNSTGSATFNGTTFGANVNVSATLTTTTGIFTGGPLTTFGGTVTVTAHSILLNGSTYNSTATFTMSSAAAPSNSISNGGNIFNGVTTISNAMNSTFRMASVTGDTFNGQLTLSLDGTSKDCKLEMAWGAGTSTSFNNNIKVRTDNTSTLSSISGLVANNAWISFGQTVAPGAAPVGGLSTLASGFTIQELAGPNVHNDPRNGLIDEFFYGDLILNNFTQLGSTAQSLNLRVPASDPSIASLRLLIRNSAFNGNATFTASNPYISGCTFSGLTNTLTKTNGSATDAFVGGAPSPVFTWDGGNTFNNTTTIDNRGQCTMVLGGTVGDDFNGNVTFNSSQTTSSFMIAQRGTNYFRGNVTLTQSGGAGPAIQFGYAGGVASFEGTSAQTLASGTSIPQFTSFVMKNASGLNLNTPMIINTTASAPSGLLTFNSGIITASSSSNYVSILASSSVTGASDASFIDGPVRKTGKVAFTFPTGDGAYYHPIGISSPTSVTDEFSARYFAADHGLGYTADVTLKTVSDCEYWTLDRLVGTYDPTVTLVWSTPYCRANYITNESALRVARWSGTQWNNLGGVPVIGPFADGTEGYVTASAALPSAASHTITLGSEDALNILPIILDSFTAHRVSNGIELLWTTSYERNNNYFTVERLKGNDFISLANVPAAKPGNLPNQYHWVDENPLSGRSYYRLKQTDVDGALSYSEIISIEISFNDTPYPNPVKETLYLDNLAITENSRIVVTDVTGHIVYSGTAKKSIDVTDFKAGIYHLGVTVKGVARWYSIKKE